MRDGSPYWQCGACPHQTGLISGTVFEASKLPLSRWFLAMQLLTQSSQQPPTKEAMAAFAASHIAPSATVVSDGLRCFGAATLVGAEHERVVTGGGKASMALPQFKWVNTLLGSLKTAISGTYHAFDFAKYAHRSPSRRVPVPLQPSLHHENHPASLALRSGRRATVRGAHHAAC